MRAMNLVRENVPLSERLAILAEESSELAQAALKLRRAVDSSNNPTPISAQEAEKHLQEEIADVIVCLTACGKYIKSVETTGEIQKTMDDKSARWIRRIMKEKGDI